MTSAGRTRSADRRALDLGVTFFDTAEVCGPFANEENVGAAAVELTDDQLSQIREAADEIQILGARYPEENDRMTNLEAPLPTA